MSDEQTWGHAFGEPVHHSLWLSRVRACAGAEPLADYLVLQANLRGYLGAYGASDLTGAPDERLSPEEIVVGLLGPWAPAEGRTLKLVLRMLQSGDVDAARLVRLARQERADKTLWWLLADTPASERTPALLELRARMSEPRGFALPRYSYDPRRLIRRPASREAGWRTPPCSRGFICWSASPGRAEHRGRHCCDARGRDGAAGAVEDPQGRLV